MALIQVVIDCHKKLTFITYIIFFRGEEISFEIKAEITDGKIYVWSVKDYRRVLRDLWNSMN